VTSSQPENPVAPTDVKPVTDLQESTFFIKYEPELAEQFANSKKAGVSVSGRCLSIVFSRMLYWSRFAKHRFEKKLFFWKSQKELSEETGFSEKQINRALKSLVDQGLLIREKFHKRFWRQVYFYHLPVSPFTKEIERMPRPMGLATRAIGSRPISTHTHRIPQGGPRAVSEARGSAAGGPSGQASPRDAAQGPAGVASGAGSKINAPRGFRSDRAKCPDLSQESSTSKKQTSRSTFQDIIQRCNFYGTAENYERVFGKFA
jgi:hypothetical protein